MSELQSANNAIRILLFRKAELIAQQLLRQLADTTSHLRKNEASAVIGALAGMESDIENLRTLMVLVRDSFQTKNSKEEL